MDLAETLQYLIGQQHNPTAIVGGHGPASIALAPAAAVVGGEGVEVPLGVVREKLDEVVKENSIQSALILNGLGSVSGYHIHVVDDKNLPPAESFLKKEEKYQ